MAESNKLEILLKRLYGKEALRGVMEEQISPVVSAFGDKVVMFGSSGDTQLKTSEEARLCNACARDAWSKRLEKCTTKAKFTYKKNHIRAGLN